MFLLFAGLLAAGPAAGAADVDPPLRTSGWGYNGYGQLGTGDVNDRGAPSAVRTDFEQVSAGLLHSLGVDAKGQVKAWGYNALGQVGDGSLTTRKSPVVVAGRTDMVQVATGAYHSLSLARDGTVWSWGWNAFGQLGDGTTRDRLRPVKVKGLSDVVSISAGWYHNLALKQDGTVWAWGWNIFGQVGDGTLTDRWLPVQVSGLTDMTNISAGAYHNIGVVSQSSSMRAWGWNGFGQLGDGTLTTRTVPVAIESPFKLATRMVSAGYLHNVGVNNTGEVFGWGWNAFGQLGTGTVADGRLPKSIACNTTRPGCYQKSNLGAVWVSAGGAHSLILATDGTVWSYGSNVFGILGDGPAEGRTVVERIPGSRSVLDLSAGFFHNLSVGTE